MVEVVRKGSKEFMEARGQYLKLFFDSEEADLIRRGVFEYGENKGKCLGFTSRKILEAKLPMPFGCPELFIQPCEENGKVTGVIWFCGRDGCICVCCREDFASLGSAYPNYCPSEGFELESEEYNEDDWEDC